MSTSSGSYSVSKLQPKFQDCLLKDTEPPSYIFVWIKIISGIISNINNVQDEGGWELESLLDNYLDRAATQPALMPSFLQDEALLIDHEDVSLTRRTRGEVSLGSGDTGGPDSAASEQDSSRTESVANAEAADRLETTIGTAADSLPPEVRAQLEEIKEQLRRPVGRVPAPSPSPSPSSTRGNRGSPFRSQRDQQPRHQVHTYRELSHEAQYLDKALFNTMQTIIKGTYLQCLMGLEGPYARYTYAIIALWKHASLNSNTRRIAAMDGMSGLSYHGDPGKWKLDFLKSVREIYESRVTMEHWIMHSAFKSFDGKNQQVQGMIADDINNEQIVGSATNFDALSSRYSQFLATMGTSKHAKAAIPPTPGEGKGKKCSRCNGTGHSGDQCKHKDATCEHCGLKGHLKKACRRKNLSQADARAKVEESRKRREQSGGSSSKPAAPVGTVKPSEVQEISESLRSRTFMGMLRALPAVPESTSPPRPSVQEEPPEGKGSVTTAAAVHEDIASHRTSSTDQNVASDDSCGMDDILRTFIESGDTSTTTSAPDVDWNAGGEALPPQHAHGVMFDTIPFEPQGNIEGRAEHICWPNHWVHHGKPQTHYGP